MAYNNRGRFSITRRVKCEGGHGGDGWVGGGGGGITIDLYNSYHKKYPLGSATGRTAVFATMVTRDTGNTVCI